MRLFCLCFVASLIALTQTGNPNSELFVTPTDSRVSVEFYYETMSPDCRDFIIQQLKPLLDIHGIFEIVDIKMIPSGNTNVDKFGREYEFTCREGEAQCIGNSIHQCCLHKYGTEICLPFIACLQKSKKNSKNWEQAIKSCSKSSAVDWEVVKACTNSIEGRQKLFESILYTRYTRPKNFPWLVVNNQHIPLKNANLVKTICENFGGSADMLPSECHAHQKKEHPEEENEEKEEKGQVKKRVNQKQNTGSKP